VKINPTLSPSAAPGDVMGAQYDYIDTDVLIGNTYFYWLEDLDTSMRVKTVAGPAEASVWYRLFMPLLSAGN
jgi:hypothetical protein